MLEDVLTFTKLTILIIAIYFAVLRGEWGAAALFFVMFLVMPHRIRRGRD